MKYWKLNEDRQLVALVDYWNVKAGDIGANIPDSCQLGSDEYPLWIDSSARIGGCVSIGECVEVGNGVNIGDCVDIGNAVRIGASATIGNCIDIGNYVSIGNWVNVDNDIKY